jgi:hypothetical protein
MVDLRGENRLPLSEPTRMANLSIQCLSTTNNTCGLCGKAAKYAVGPRLFLSDTGDVVCRDCGQRHAPALAALLDLASVAERVGHVGRHTLVPPMAALLDLARAAERYSDNRPRALRNAA